MSASTVDNSMQYLRDKTLITRIRHLIWLPETGRAAFKTLPKFESVTLHF